jgi:hypothetical protein
MGFTFKAAVTTVLAVCATAALAQQPAPKRPADPIETDRPDFTESTSTIPPGMIQLEGGVTFANTNGTRSTALGEILLRIPAGSRAEFRLGLNSYTFENGGGSSASGLEDTTIGMKLRLANKSEKPALFRPDTSIILMTSIPTGSAAYRESTLVPTAKLALGWDLTSRASASMNVNYTYASDQGSRFDEFATSLSLGYSLSEKVGAFLETFAFLPGGYRGPNAQYVNGGFSYLVNQDFQLDIRAGQGVSGARPDYFAGVGASVRW